MLRTLELLHDDLIKEFEILDFKSGEDFYFLSILYSYHWQDKNGSLRIRWDNAPHHSNLRTFPDHKHIPQLEESDEMELENVLKEIKGLLKTQKG